MWHYHGSVTSTSPRATFTVQTCLELVSKELNHLAAILHVYVGGLNFMKYNFLVPCDHKSWVGDGDCDDEANTPGCYYDGGDCCLENVITDFCNSCECLDPTPTPCSNTTDRGLCHKREGNSQK